MIRLRADMAYLLAFKQKDEASPFLKKTIAILKKHNISSKVIYVDIWDLMMCLEKLRELIDAEKENQIFFNVSTGTKITAISSMLACMLWNCEPYYAKTEYNEIKISKKIIPEKIHDVISIPTYKMITPKPEFLQLLKIIQRNKGKIKKKRLIEELKKLELIYPMGPQALSKPAEHGQLKTILDPMIKLEYVEVETIGRNSIVSITEQGSNTLKIFGTS
jgi:hypothetical protein